MQPRGARVAPGLARMPARVASRTVTHWADEPYEDLRVEGTGSGTAVVTLALPERRNMMSEGMTASWVRLMAALAADPDLRCVVVTGEGSAFCSGGDTAWIASRPTASVAEQCDRMLVFYRAWLSVRDVAVPTIAAVNGPAIGAGLALALACDLRYAALDARLGVPFTALGLHPGMGTTWLLPEVVGAAAARELLLTGRLVSGAEAAALGLVTRAVPVEEVLDTAMAAARAIEGTAPVATRSTTEALRARPSSLDAALQAEARAQAVTLTTRDLLEGIAAARERRPPRFTGH